MVYLCTRVTERFQHVFAEAASFICGIVHL
jgi:hypothetical protein